MNKNTPPLIRFKNLPLEKAEESIRALDEPGFRARQAVKWVYQKRVDSFGAMNNIAKTTREKFAAYFAIDKLAVAATLRSKAGDAVKFGFRLRDCPYIAESVLLIDGDRRTACLSSQLGCALGCAFCETGRLGFIRNLTQEEIVGQLIGIDDYCAAQGDRLVTNVVFMGMGEALSNFDALISSIAIIMDGDCFNIGGRRVTVSTAGVVPSIERLMAEGLTVGLAISLNSFSNERRSAIMPINRKYPIEALVAVAGRYFKTTGRRVTFEYVVVEGETDTMEAARALKKLLGALPCKINLIPLNPLAGSTAAPPSRNRLMQFAGQLHEFGLAATVRISRGRDIYGACGQLTAHYVAGGTVSTAR
jgi:23S rRNA (adenine2503-C2)-methyltransferase